MNAKTLAGALAVSLASALVAQPAAAADQEKCYGVAMKGHNDCAGNAHDCAGKASKSYSASEFKLVPAGTCEKMKVHGHKGTLTPA